MPGWLVGWAKSCKRASAKLNCVYHTFSPLLYTERCLWANWVDWWSGKQWERQRQRLLRAHHRSSISSSKSSFNALLLSTTAVASASSSSSSTTIFYSSEHSAQQFLWSGRNIQSKTFKVAIWIKSTLATTAAPALASASICHQRHPLWEALLRYSFLPFLFPSLNRSHTHTFILIFFFFSVSTLYYRHQQQQQQQQL